jgi:putative metal-binding protein
MVGARVWAVTLVVTSAGCASRAWVEDDPPDTDNGGTQSASMAASGGGSSTSSGMTGTTGGGGMGGGTGGSGGSDCSVEVCNGADDDCDGFVDEEDPALGQTCDTGLLGICAVGSTACSLGALVCAQSTPPQPEVCNGSDDDCNGTIDESDPLAGQPCDTGVPGICANGVFVCTNGALACPQVVLPGLEACDDVDTDCDGAPDPAACPKIVFVTSELHQGNLGGFAGADAICQSLADSAGLQGVFKAWLSGSVSAAQRLVHHQGPYQLVDASVVASSWNDLVDGTITHAINQTETGGPPPAGTSECGPWAVWTNTDDSGNTFDAACSCAEWTSTNENCMGLGEAYYLDWWTLYCSWANRMPPVCSAWMPFYCLEQ